MQKFAVAGEPQQSQTKFSIRFVEESLIFNKIINGHEKCPVVGKFIYGKPKWAENKSAIAALPKYR
jgi:hypothetical protein